MSMTDDEFTETKRLLERTARGDAERRSAARLHLQLAFAILAERTAKDFLRHDGSFLTVPLAMRGEPRLDRQPGGQGRVVGAVVRPSLSDFISDQRPTASEHLG